VKRAAIAVSICVGIAPTAAFAFDWSINGTASETVELNSNQFLRTPAAGSLGSYSTLSGVAEARTPTDKLDLSADGNYKKYWGPGVDGETSEFLNYGFKARYEHSEKDKSDREYVESSWRQQSTSLAVLNDLGVSVNTGGFLDRLTASGGIDRALTSLDKIFLFATSTNTSYEPSSGGTPFTDTLARGTWRHALNSMAAITASSEAELLNYGNAFNTQIEIYRNQLGVEATLSPVLSFRGNAGPVYLETQNGVSSSVIGPTALSTPTPSALLDWVGDATLTYRMLKNTTLTVVANQTVGPSVVGSLFKRDSITASVSQTLNANSTLSFSASANRQISTTSTDFASASATYSYTLARDWMAQFTYRYLHRFASTGGTSIIDPITGIPTVSGTGPADSHSVMLVVSRNWTLLPPGN
jgi:hypothetical protein